MMALPLVALAVPALASGLADLPSNFLGIPAHWMTGFLGGEAEPFSSSVAATASIVGAVGIALAYLMYVNKAIAAEAIGRTFKPVYTVLVNKYYFDFAYEKVFVGGVFYNGLSTVSDWVDRNIVDNVGNLTGWISRNFGRMPGGMQSGQVQTYGFVISVGLVIIIAAVWIWG